LLFANEVIWVEGPSDAIYIERWLEIFQLEKFKKIKYKSGFAYQFQTFGGVLLDSFYAENFLVIKKKKRSLIF